VGEGDSVSSGRLLKGFVGSDNGALIFGPEV